MDKIKLIKCIKNVLDNIPKDWLELTTHRLDVYREELAKIEFIDSFENLIKTSNISHKNLANLPTAYDYIRLGHPLSSILEWVLANLYNLKPENVITFSSTSISLLAILRKNIFENRNTQILHTNELPDYFDTEILENIYGYNFEIKKIDSLDLIPVFEGEQVFISQNEMIGKENINHKIDFHITILDGLGSILFVNKKDGKDDVSRIQHVRRRETISMTPANCFTVLEKLTGRVVDIIKPNNAKENKQFVEKTIKKITHTSSKPLIGSSGLSIQYAIMMGLIHYVVENFKDKDIKIIVPPNCYGGTNDQARRVAECLTKVQIIDLPVDGENDMVKSINLVLDEVASMDAVPLIIAEIPTNPRVEVPNLIKLKQALEQSRQAPNANTAVEPIFILDQTFCPNYNFLGENQILSSVKSISYVSGSKFPSGGKCTAGYCVSNNKAKNLIPYISKHLVICDNQATDLQIQTLAVQLPSMKQRIKAAYNNTRDFVNFIKKTLPASKINFVSEKLAEAGFTPSVFSLDLPTKGKSPEEREMYKRALNNKLITMMINRIPNESKYCVSYGQLQGCYWTIPATSTQGTTKEEDKDYIARVSVSPSLDLELHKQVFVDFVSKIPDFKIEQNINND